MAKGKLSSSPRINYLLGSMGIFSYYDVINHLPRRYDDFSLTKERGLEDKERVVLLGKVISIPRLNKAKRVDVTTFDFMTVNKTSDWK